MACQFCCIPYCNCYVTTAGAGYSHVVEPNLAPRLLNGALLFILSTFLSNVFVQFATILARRESAHAGHRGPWLSLLAIRKLHNSAVDTASAEEVANVPFNLIQYYGRKGHAAVP